LKKVLIIQAQMIQYRVPFFTKLGEALRQDGIDLTVAYSDPLNRRGNNDHCDLPSDSGSKVRGYWVLGGRALYQPLLGEVVAADLVIAQEANRLLLNYLLAALSTLGTKRVAFWGYGQNIDASPSDLSEKVRRRIVSKVDWYFAYTRGAAKYLASNGLRPEAITVVANAIDTREFTDLMENTSEADVVLKKREFGIEEKANVGLFCGVLNPDKGIGFLLDAADVIRAQSHGFHLIVIGGGQEEERLRAAAQTRPWIHYVGPQFGAQKALFFKMADVFLLPGYVGLAILDAFAAGLPLLTTNIPFHRPEIEYLEHGANGLMTVNTVEEYAANVIALFSDPAALRSLREGALASAREYSIDAMVRNFRAGIHACLGIDGKGATA
jgi:glycosyltransferase involved in cell wall biosynthesis